MGQSATSLKWYNYGKSRFLKNGFYEAEDFLTNSMKNKTAEKIGQKTILITGANSGLGYSLTQMMGQLGHRVYMVCRNPERADNAKTQMVTENPDMVEPEILIADCGDPESLQNAISGISGNLDCVVCNAGALPETFRMNAPGTHELNHSVHLLHGYHLLSKLCLPLFTNSNDPRVVVVSSGGMYQRPLDVKYLINQSSNNFDGVTSYCYCKRAQVVLAEQFAKQISNAKFYSCHPGWVLTPGVSVLGSFISWTGEENWRSPEEGTLGIAHLVLEKSSNLENGEFYFDGKVVPKHLPSTFYSFACSDTEVPSEIEENLWDYCESENSKFTEEKTN